MKKILFVLMVISVCFSCKKEETQCVENLNPDCACYLIYAPVCGCNDKTYANDCVAECYGITEYVDGECP